MYDGHAGLKAAASSASHMHEKLVDSPHFETNPSQAIIDAIKDVDKVGQDVLPDVPEKVSSPDVRWTRIRLD